MIKREYPPNIEEIRRVFTLKKGVVFCHYPDIYAPDGISPDVFAHEVIHLAQQKDYGVKKWWNRYLSEPAFRASQEIPAYQAQYEFMKAKIKDRNKLDSFLRFIANELGGELYGNILTPTEAYNAIKSEKKYLFDIH